jgi:hypothetical protein
LQQQWPNARQDHRCHHHDCRRRHRRGDGRAAHGVSLRAQAQRHCPSDQVVWLDFRKGVYYRRGQKRYGQGFDGSFVCLNEARDSRYRRSLLGLR